MPRRQAAPSRYPRRRTGDTMIHLANEGDPNSDSSRSPLIRDTMSGISLPTPQRIGGQGSSREHTLGPLCTNEFLFGIELLRPVDIGPSVSTFV